MFNLSGINSVLPQCTGYHFTKSQFGITYLMRKCHDIIQHSRAILRMSSAGPQMTPDFHRLKVYIYEVTMNVENKMEDIGIRLKIVQVGVG